MAFSGRHHLTVHLKVDWRLSSTASDSFMQNVNYFTGDVATGSGVDRHIISMVISRLMSGLHLNLGKTCVKKQDLKREMGHF